MNKEKLNLRVKFDVIVSLHMKMLQSSYREGRANLHALEGQMEAFLLSIKGTSERKELKR